jgi:hypothetical protein
MKKRFLFTGFAAFTLFITSCSGDDSPAPSQNTDTTQLLGKWVINKALYGDTEPILYESDGDCGKEVLEFYSNGEVSETIYVDSNCMNGGTGTYSWWVLPNSKIAYGAQNSYHHTVTVNGNNLILDATEEAAYIKYYHKVN